MQATTGRDSSSSPPSSWVAEDRHKSAHFILTIFPDGKLILTTPDQLQPEQFLVIKELFRDWMNSEVSFPLVIGDCLVRVQTVDAREIVVE